MQKDLNKLQHLHVQTSSWANVYILDTWAVIDAEAEAMLQALHSRSTGWIKHHLEILKQKWAANFMSKFYVWYGHKSIGDCGSATLFVEWISMLAAKAIQHHKLYSGQESSTRYIDFSKQKIHNPSWTSLGEQIQEKQRQFYLNILPPLKNHLAKKYPRNPDQKESIWQKAINAKAFDIARGFLPAWTSTNLAWHSNLRQIQDRILRLNHHPLEEVREVAKAILQVSIQKYPNSFTTKTYEDTERYAELSKDFYYFFEYPYPEFEVYKDNIDTKQVKKYQPLLEQRPNAKTELPQFLNSLGIISFKFLLDFGSFRDLQRHRAPDQQMPLLTDKIGFHPWYIQQLPKELQKEAQKHLKEIKQLTDQLDISPEIRQYYIPMWYLTTNFLQWTLPALVYLAELRSTRFVHPTLRKVAHQIWKYIEQKHNIKLFLDNEDIDFDIKRGLQDIQVK